MAKKGPKSEPVSVDYDKENDIFYLYLLENRPCISYDVADNIIARIDPKTGELVAIELWDFRDFFQRFLGAEESSKRPKQLVIGGMPIVRELVDA